MAAGAARLKFGLRLRSEERAQLPLSAGRVTHMHHSPFECGSQLILASRSAHACHETFESGSSTLSGLRSRTPNSPHVNRRILSRTQRIDGLSMQTEITHASTIIAATVTPRRNHAESVIPPSAFSSTSPMF